MTENKKPPLSLISKLKPKHLEPDPDVVRNLEKMLESARSGELHAMATVFLLQGEEKGAGMFRGGGMDGLEMLGLIGQLRLLESIMIEAALDMGEIPDGDGFLKPSGDEDETTDPSGA